MKIRKYLQRTAAPYLFILFLGIIGAIGLLGAYSLRFSCGILCGYYLVFLPFIGGACLLGCLSIYVMQQVVHSSWKAKLILSPIFFIVYFLGSIFSYFYISEIYDRTSNGSKFSEEIQSCLDNFRKYEGLFHISNLSMSPMYTRQKNVAGVKMTFILSSEKDIDVSIAGSVQIMNIGGASGSYNQHGGLSLKHGAPAPVEIDVSEFSLSAKEELRYFTKDFLTLEPSIKIYPQNYSNDLALTFVGEKSHSDTMCNQGVSNKRIWPVYESNELRAVNFPAEVFMPMN